MTQGSVLRPLLYLVYINAWDNNTVWWVLKFADDPKFYFKVKRYDNDSDLQKDLEERTN